MAREIETEIDDRAVRILTPQEILVTHVEAQIKGTQAALLETSSKIRQLKDQQDYQQAQYTALQNKMDDLKVIQGLVEKAVGKGVSNGSR